MYIQTGVYVDYKHVFVGMSYIACKNVFVEMSFADCKHVFEAGVSMKAVLLQMSVYYFSTSSISIIL